MSKNDAICLIEDFKNVSLIEFDDKCVHMKFKNGRIYTFVFSATSDSDNAQRAIDSALQLEGKKVDDGTLSDIFKYIGPRKGKAEFISGYLDAVKVSS